MPQPGLENARGSMDDRHCTCGLLKKDKHISLFKKWYFKQEVQKYIHILDLCGEYVEECTRNWWTVVIS